MKGTMLKQIVSGRSFRKCKELCDQVAECRSIWTKPATGFCELHDVCLNPASETLANTPPPIGTVGGFAARTVSPIDS